MTYDSEVLADSPLTFLVFSDTTGTAVEDASPNNRDGFWESNTATKGVAGLLTDDPNTTCKWNASGASYARILYAAWMNTTAVTLEFLLEAPAAGTQRIIANRDDGFTPIWILYVTSAGKVAWKVWDSGGGSRTYTGTTTLTPGKRYHLAVTHSGTAQRFYLTEEGTYTTTVDLTASDTFTLRTGNTTVLIGASSTTPTYWDTRLARFAWYGSALSQARVEVHALAFDPPTPVSITATVDETTRTVSLYIADGVPPYVVTAHPSGFESYVIRSTYGSVTGEPDSRVAIDGDVPLNVPTYYTVTDDDTPVASATSDTVTVESTTAVLADALDPTNEIDVVVVSQPPNTYEARSVWWDVLGQAAPFPSIGPMRLRNGDLVLRTETRQQRLALASLLSSGRPLLLRSPYPDAVDDVVLLVERAVDELVLAELPSGARTWTLTYQAVSRDPLGVYTFTPGRTYDDLNAEAATYDDLNALFGSYDLMRAGT